MYCAIDVRLCLWEIFARINAFKRKSTCFANTLVYKWYLNLHTWEANGLTFCCSDFYGHLFFNQLSQQTKWHKTTINVKNVLFYFITVSCFCSSLKLCQLKCSFHSWQEVFASSASWLYIVKHASYNYVHISLVVFCFIICWIDYVSNAE